ncbi:MAG TPA: carboxypeptidase regulatory-like domain-containing protein, partial [Dehalococcoidia bacterium]|nr:carboxypeptidase regulatory-like domain-containing protein [Dehalococcoidia bacterium]
GLPPGIYRVQVNAGALGLVPECYPGSLLCLEPEAVPVVAGQNTPDIDFVLEVGGTISGTVLESDGVTPVANAFVSASGIDIRYSNQTATAADGSYAIGGLAPGSYLVEANAADQGFVYECYQAQLLCQEPTPVSVSLGMETANIDFTLELGGTILGTVLESDGVTPVPNASVYASGINYENDAITASDGTYAIRGLPAGNYRVEVNAADRGFVYECYLDDLVCQNPTPVAVTLGADTSGIDFTLEVGGTISGTVLESDGGTPVPNASAYASGINTGYGSGAATAGDGTYAIRGLPPGNYRVEITFVPGQEFLYECYQSDLLCQNPTPVEVTLGEDTSNIDFTLEMGGTISGTVLESDGVTPVAGVFMYATGINVEHGNGAVTASDGSYMIPRLAPGNYRVEVYIVDQIFLNECYQDDLLCQNPTPVAVALDENTPNIDFTLEVDLPNAAALSPHQDPLDGASGLKLAISQGIGPGGLLASFQARLFYPDASDNPAFPAGTLCVSILDVRQMDLPITDRNIDNIAGVATFDGSAATGAGWPVDLGYALTRLTGSASQQCPVDSTLTSISDTDGNPLATPEVPSQIVQRGDAQADGVVNITDARFIAQHLVGSRPACSMKVDTGCLHSVNAASVKQDGDADRKTIADALFIAQQLVGLRDEYYNLLP